MFCLAGLACKQPPADVGGECKGDRTCKEGLICKGSTCTKVGTLGEVFKKKGKRASAVLEALRDVHAQGEKLNPLSIEETPALFNVDIDFATNAVLLDHSHYEGPLVLGDLDRYDALNILVNHRGWEKTPDRDGSFGKGLKQLGTLRYACARHRLERKEAVVGGAIKEKTILGKEVETGKGFIPGRYKAAIVCYRLKGSKAKPVGSALVTAASSPELKAHSGYAKDALNRDLRENIARAERAFRLRFKDK